MAMLFDSKEGMDVDGGFVEVDVGKRVLRARRSFERAEFLLTMQDTSN